MSVLEGPLVFVDVETTGMSYTRGRVIEVAAIRVENGKVTGSFNSLVDPQAELPQFITELTGITRSDLIAAPSFYDIADELYGLMQDAVFVAHNVRFDYGFLKQEFKRTGRKFSPKLLCTVRLSKALYPDVRSNKLQDLIDRCGIKVNARHRAYDDANAMWQFIQHSAQNFPAPAIEAAIKLQLRSPSLPKNIDPMLVKGLPEEPGVYIFQDSGGRPLYIGKSINLKKRVLSHFSSDHEFESEFKISQQVTHIETIETNGELEALLLESSLVKDMQPLFNRQLRKRQKLTLARQQLRGDGYLGVSIEDVASIDPELASQILGVYTTRGKAKSFLEETISDYGLCPKLMGLEKGPGSCFSYQLKKCSGACAGREDAEVYNQRLLSAFEGRRLQEWPYESPVIIEEKSHRDRQRFMVVDQWCVVAQINLEPGCEPDIKLQAKMFDIDTYKILRSYLASKAHKLVVKPFPTDKLNSLADSLAV
jgi:DNA polymerase-3 subunit epsilon